MAYIFKQSQVFKKCVVTHITNEGNNREHAEYNLYTYLRFAYLKQNIFRCNKERSVLI